MIPDLLYDLGTRLCPPGATNNQRITAVSILLEAPESTVRKWWYGHACPRGASLSLLKHRLQKEIAARPLP